jgi:hypothetical protein
VVRIREAHGTPPREMLIILANQPRQPGTDGIDQGMDPLPLGAGGHPPKVGFQEGPVRGRSGDVRRSCRRRSSASRSQAARVTPRRSPGRDAGSAAAHTSFPRRCLQASQHPQLRVIDIAPHQQLVQCQTKGRPGSHDDVPFDDILELPHIAWPTIAGEGLQRLGGDGIDALLQPSRIVAHDRPPTLLPVQTAALTESP